jgi:hypothetical protein
MQKTSKSTKQSKYEPDLEVFKPYNKVKVTIGEP